MTSKEILEIVPAIHSASLVGNALKLLKKKKKRKNLFGTAADTIVGASMIKAESDMIAGM
jgi:hypothetical protein